MDRQSRHHEAQPSQDLRTTRVRLPDAPMTGLFQGWGVKF